jgi:type IV secretory pathway VirB10-like protein
MREEVISVQVVCAPGSFDEDNVCSGWTCCDAGHPFLQMVRPGTKSADASRAGAPNQKRERVVRRTRRRAAKKPSSRQVTKREDAATNERKWRPNRRVVVSGDGANCGGGGPHVAACSRADPREKRKSDARWKARNTQKQSEMIKNKRRKRMPECGQRTRKVARILSEVKRGQLTVT